MKPFRPFSLWSHEQSERLLTQYQTSNLFFGIDARELAFLTGESTSVSGILGDGVCGVEPCEPCCANSSLCSCLCEPDHMRAARWKQEAAGSKASEQTRLTDAFLAAYKPEKYHFSRATPNGRLRAEPAKGAHGGATVAPAPAAEEMERA